MMSQTMIETVLALYWFGAIMTVSALLTWLERKESALIQDRIGANRAKFLGFRWLGLPHILADAVKMLTKEDFVPRGISPWLHGAAPWITLVTAVLPMAAVPFGDTLKLGERQVELRILSLNVGLVFVLGIASLAMYGVVMAGWASRNKWAILGSLRAGAQFIAFAVVLGTSLVGAVMLYGSLDLQDMVRWQNHTIFYGLIPRWGIFYQPMGALVFLVAGIAETKRIPFDLPEGESEIIGYFLEYSGMKFGAFFLADFVESLMVSMLWVTIYFGGWNLPFGPSRASGTIPSAILQSLVFWGKVSLVSIFLLLVRWTLPRFRIDQALRLGWVYLLPLAMVNTFATAMIILWLG